jgi:hypothetical protein
MAVSTTFPFIRDARTRRGLQKAFSTLDAQATAASGVTGGVIEASKVVAVDADKDVGDFRNLDCTNLDAGKSGTAGSVDVFPATASKGKAALVCANQDGDTTVTITVQGMGQATAVKLPDPGVSTAYLMQMSAENDREIVTATVAELNNAADVSGRVQALTSSGAVTSGKQSVELNHISVPIAATIADAANHPGFFVVKDTSASGTEAHTLTLTAGTFDGTNNVATLNAPKEALVVYFDSAGNGTVVANVGAVALSGP